MCPNMITMLTEIPLPLRHITNTSWITSLFTLRLPPALSLYLAFLLMVQTASMLTGSLMTRTREKLAVNLFLVRYIPPFSWFSMHKVDKKNNSYRPLIFPLFCWFLKCSSVYHCNEHSPRLSVWQEW